MAAPRNLCRTRARHSMSNIHTVHSSNNVQLLSHTTGQEAPDPPTHILSPWFCYSQCCFCCAVLTCDITHITLVQLQHPGRGVAAGADNPNGTGHTQLRCVQCTKHHPPSCHATGTTFTHKHTVKFKSRQSLCRAQAWL